MAAINGNQVDQWQSVAIKQHQLISQCDVIEARIQRMADQLCIRFDDILTQHSIQRKQRKAMSSQQNQQLAHNSLHREHRVSPSRGNTMKLHKFITPSHVEYEILLCLLLPGTQQLISFRNQYIESHYKQITAHKLKLNKLLVIALVRDIYTLLTNDHVVVPINTGVKLIKQSLLPITDIDEIHALLLQRLIDTLCHIELTMQQCTTAIKQGNQLARITHDLDAKSRNVLHHELYDIHGDNTILSDSVTQSHGEYALLQQRSWYSNNIDPFIQLKLSYNPLIELGNIQREQCIQCHKKSSIYCPKCIQLTLPSHIKIPSSIVLPVYIDILYHPQENIKKSTSLHACILASDYCHIKQFDHTSTQQYNTGDTVLLYPSDNAQYIDTLTPEQANSIKRVICIESTWPKGTVVASHPTLNKLKHIKLRRYESSYWRYQELGSTYLSTLEAIYYCCVELYNIQYNHQISYNGQYDDLLYFYVYQHSMIRQRYEADANQPNHKPPKTWQPPLIKHNIQ